MENIGRSENAAPEIKGNIDMDHIEILSKAVAILRDRGEQYGHHGEVFFRACSIFEMITGRRLSRWEAAMFLHSLKMARIRKSAMKADNYEDGINYMAFAAEFSRDLLTEGAIDDSVREMAEKLSPQFQE